MLFALKHAKTIRNMTPTTSPPHLHMFNPAPLKTNPCGNPDFARFSELPTELRQKIWRHAIERPRMLQLQIWSLKFMEMIVAKLGVDSPLLPSPVGSSVLFVRQNCRVLSKLLRVNSEARDVALSFYRVHIPCRMAKKHGKHELSSIQGMVYINPEFDFISFKIKHHQEDIDFPLLIHYFKTMDPQRVGLLNLTLDHSSLGALSNANLEGLEPDVKQSVADTLKNLHQVFVTYIPAMGRLIPCWDHMRYPEKIYVNRSYPLASSSLSFQRIPQDPRSIGLDLNVVYMDWICSFLPQWRETLRKWGIAEATTETRLLVTCSTSSDTVFDYKSAQLWLKREDERYIRRGYPDWYTSSHCWGDSIVAKSRKEQLEDAVAVKPAFGFWLFPADAFDLGENHHCHNEFNVLDLTEHWPELCLWNLD